MSNHVYYNSRWKMSLSKNTFSAILEQWIFFGSRPSPGLTFVIKCSFYWILPSLMKFWLSKITSPDSLLVMKLLVLRLLNLKYKYIYCVPDFLAQFSLYYLNMAALDCNDILTHWNVCASIILLQWFEPKISMAVDLLKLFYLPRAKVLPIVSRNSKIVIS